MPTELPRPQVAASRRQRSLISDAAQLARAVSLVRRCPTVGLDVETELYNQRLCLVQIAVEAETFLIDALLLLLPNLQPLHAVFADPAITKIIHNASFERRILGSVGLELAGVFDTLTASRRLRGYTSNGGHSLAAVCHRELGFILSKELQCSNWAQRPLTSNQLDYAARDAEVLLELHVVFNSVLPSVQTLWSE